MVKFEGSGDFLSLTDLKELGDGDLARLLARGCSEAMTIIFDRYYTVMMRVAIRVVRNRAEAEDVVQVAFADFYRQIQAFDESKGSLRGWLLQYVYGRSINRIKNLAVRQHSNHVELSDVPPSELANLRDSVLTLNESEAKLMVEQVLGTLDEKKRRIVELVCFTGLTIPEVAALMHEPRVRIQNHYYRAISALRISLRNPEVPSRNIGKQPKPISDRSIRKLPNEEVELG